MVCRVCGANNFDRVQYRSPEVRAPALECTGCKALLLDESVANSEGERDSVRLAVAVRAGVADRAGKK